MNRLLLAALLVAAAPCHLDAQFSVAEYQQRRDALVARMPDAAIMVFGARAPEHDYLEFFQNPEMLYLSGIREPEAALLMVKEGGRTTATVFVLPRDPAVELWSGARIGLDGATRISGVAARVRGELHTVLDSLASSGRLPLHVGGGVTGPRRAPGQALTPEDQYLAALSARYPPLRVVPTVNAAVTRLRGTKSAAELALIRRAAEITVASHLEAMRAMRPRMHEYEIEATIEYGFRRRGAERPSFASIVGSGPNATVLHYNANDRQIEAGDMVVMDVGASVQGYAADVTRTIPAAGAFTPAQRDIYQIVRDAQAAAERNALPGMRAQAMSDSATAVIAAGLARLGLIESPAATYDVVGQGGAISQAPQIRLYFMHGLGHGIGLEVHDPDQYYLTGTIAAGSAFTIEPGIYVRGNLPDVLADTPRNRALIARLRPVLERYRNIGVRIEDDYIVTENGLEWISRAPREIAEIEAAMRPVP
ncbi:MAG: aminopeptidase P family protein [Gemmatimonadaceae bacterium]